MTRFSSGPTLFWRTFVLVVLLIVFCVTGWVQSFRVLNETPYELAASQRIISLVNLTRYALVTSDPQYRPDLLMVLASRENVQVLPREEDDRVKLLSAESGSAAEVVEIVTSALGPDTVMASRVNGIDGLWVSLSIDGDGYWLMTNSRILKPQYGKTWIWWALAALVGSLLGAGVLTRRLILPLNNLSDCAKQFGRGMVPAALPEDSGPEELREVNSSFNRMVQDIGLMEKDREMLLAGVSHDLRTPITRLRLEAELANLPEDTRSAMVSDLEQMEGIVNQFIDYARRSNLPQEPVSLSETVSMTLTAARLDINPSVKLACSIQPDVFVMAHPVELSRMVQNICTNAQRYGTGEDGILELSVTVAAAKGTAILTICDHGPGLDMKEAQRLMRPFERGDAARGGTAGSGLGLAIVDRIVRRSGGQLELGVAEPHGLRVEVRMPASPKPSAKAAKKQAG